MFLPDHGCKLIASLSFLDPEAGPRPLYSCVRPECGCAGVFFKDCGGLGCQLQVRVWVEGEPRDAAARERVRAFFADRPPEVTLFDGKDAVTVSTPQCRKFTATPGVSGGGVWTVTFRPQRITGEGVLACLKVVVGPNVVWTPGIELRTKPSEWLMVHGLREDATVGDVSALMARCSPHKPNAIVVRRVDGRVGAFVQFPSRAVATGALVGWKSLAPEPTTALSLIISLNRAYKDDRALRSALVPTSAITEVVQQQARPGYLPPPPAVVAVASDSGDDCDGGSDSGCGSGWDSDEEECIVFPIAVPVPRVAGGCAPAPEKDLECADSDVTLSPLCDGLPCDLDGVDLPSWEEYAEEFADAIAALCET